jgi:hypothetical protein
MNEGDATGHWDALGGTFNSDDITGDITDLSTKVNTLIGGDANKSVSSIATEVVEAALTWKTITSV